MAYATFNDAARAAIRMSMTHSDDYWVVFEDNAYHVLAIMTLKHGLRVQNARVCGLWPRL
jgi:hypothetical protein